MYLIIDKNNKLFTLKYSLFTVKYALTTGSVLCIVNKCMIIYCTCIDTISPPPPQFKNATKLSPLTLHVPETTQPSPLELWMYILEFSC